MCGPCKPPAHSKLGETKFGFTIGERVRVIESLIFKGWHGHVRSFEDQFIVVNLDEPLPGHCQWFRPSDLQKAPE